MRALHSKQLRAAGRSLWIFVRSDVLPALIAIGVAILFWAIVTSFVVPAWLPRPSTVGSKIGTLLGDPKFMSALISGIGIFALGLAIALGVGTAAGVAVALNEKARLALGPYINIILVVPSVVLAPILLVVFGISRLNILVLVVVFAVGLVAVNTAGAVRSIDQTLVEVGRVYGGRRFALFARIILPSMLPNYFSGLHLGETRAFKGMVVGQDFLGVIGLGLYEARFQDTFDSAGIWALAVILISVALIFTWIVRAADHVFNFWAYQE